MALASGATFAGYTVARKLGSGVTGEVYLAQDPRSERWQALKVLAPDLSPDGDFGRRFRAETPTATHLYHPHIVESTERGEFGGRLYVAMEYIDGINAARLTAQRFPAVSPVGEVLAMVTAIAGALDYAHERGMLHRDVKPTNVLVANRGEGEQRIVLTDFGMAGPTDSARGSPYAAPEQLTGATIDPRADQYALAATAFDLLSGAPPAPGSRLSDQRPELARLDAVFAKALAREPADRFATCSEFAEAANEQAGVSIGDRSPEAVFVADYPAYSWPEADDGHPKGPSPAAGDFPGAAPRPRRPRKLALGLAAVAILLAGVVAGLAVGRKGETATRVAGPVTNAPAVAAPRPGGTPSPVVPLDGMYRLEVERTKETFNYIADPQPPDVNTWWAFRSSCTPATCRAAAMQLDDSDHQRLVSPAGGELVMQFSDGEWQSQTEDMQFGCVGPDGQTQTQATTLVLSLRPQPRGDLVGEETVTVQTNECGQRSAVMRIPTVLSRNGERPPAVVVPDPNAGSGGGSASAAPPSPAATGPHR